MAYTFRLVKGSALSWAELDTNFQTMDQQYTDTVAASSVAISSANFKGNWSSLSGAINIPASVRHSGKYWMLLNNLADITTSQPGVSADWSEINAGNVTGPASATDGHAVVFDGTTGRLIKSSGAPPVLLSSDQTISGVKTFSSTPLIREDIQVISTNTTAVRSKTYVLTSSLTLTLPLTPSPGDWIRIQNSSGVKTCVVGRNGSNIMSLAQDMTIDIINAGLFLVYTDATRGWVIIS